jgi:hypothetical protein
VKTTDTMIEVSRGVWVRERYLPTLGVGPDPVGDGAPRPSGERVPAEQQHQMTHVHG